jgi:hypothetical protein
MLRLTDDSVELGSLVTVVDGGTILELPSAESSEVLFIEGRKAALAKNHTDVLVTSLTSTVLGTVLKHHQTRSRRSAPNSSRSGRTHQRLTFRKGP